MHGEFHHPKLLQEELTFSFNKWPLPAIHLSRSIVLYLLSSKNFKRAFLKLILESTLNFDYIFQKKTIYYSEKDNNHTVHITNIFESYKSD